MSNFECIDPGADDEVFECTAPPPAVPPCSADVQKAWVVDTSAQAQALAAAVNCSGGSFEVEWRGRVVVDEPIFVVDGTVLAVTGAGSDAVMDGGGLIRVLTVVDASLLVSRVNISSGASVVGGAIAAAGSTLVFNQTNFVGNSATGNGGAIYVSRSSSVQCVGGGTLADNRAAMEGGAMYVTGSSVVSCGGSWVDNTSGSSGGAISVKVFSNVSWDYEEAYFASNSAARDGGALSVENGSSVSWHAATVFDSNSAVRAGGAGVGFDGSRMFWDAPTVFESNQAGNGGGALAILNSSISWSADTVFSGNAAGRNGGAVYAQAATVTWGGEIDTTLEDNRSGFSGGAVMLTIGSHCSCDEETTNAFVSNSAGDDGGAVQVEGGSSVSFSGSTSFAANSAVGDPLNPGAFGWGGALTVYDSTATWGGTASFTKNTGDTGGAIAVQLSRISWSGVTTMLGNSASVIGGALASAASHVSFAGSSSFVNNSAAAGGAMFLTTSSVEWVGQTQFGGNSAKASAGGVLGVAAGGALTLRNSSISWSGDDTEFFFNTADGGGAIYASNDSLVFWSGDKATFTNNSATGFGGALYLTATSGVSWSGDTKFDGNTAGSSGGAVFIYNQSYISWTGDTTFSSNRALTSGGALFVYDGTSVGWTGTTTFSSNVASADGGVVGTFSLHASSNPRQSSLVIDGPTTFSNNTCGANGGVFALLGGLSVYVGTAVDVVFSSNHAEVAGGAVFVSGTDVGPIFTSASFLSNSAQVGGAVSTVGTGNLKQAALVEPPNPTTFDRCRFIDNTATATGGAIESAAGQDYFVGSIFQGNTAGTGGALRLAGTSSFVNCSFVENVSDDGGGAAVSNIGFVSGMENAVFTDNIFACPTGMFLDYNAVSVEQEGYS